MPENFRKALLINNQLYEKIGTKPLVINSKKAAVFALETVHSLISSAFIIVNTSFWGILSISSVFYSPGGTMAHLCMQLWSRTSLWVSGVNLLTEGLENIDDRKVQIFASNHNSHFDIFVLSAVIPVRFGWVAKKELFKIPFMGWHMKLQRYIAIDRSNKELARKSMDEAADKIREGNRITIFPEGTRSKDGNLQPFKKGLFYLCLKTGVPIVPIYIDGTGRVLRSHSLRIKPGTVKIRIGKEMKTSGYTEDRIEDMMNELRKRMLALRQDRAS
ncbi:MAG: 1-acyl-sn-glycerol-3-phosphate acyltransferase [Spirochaetes bacterium]|nr:1-acyl-sn-glycerol-3-phosphate acyltransferase [Spirochaetota bacterium]